MQEFLAAHGVAFDEIYSFTGLPDCPNLAKPDPQMIHRAAEEHDLDLSRSWLIGDADRDIEMANRAGVANTVRVVGEKAIGIEACHTVADLAEARDLALQINVI